MCCVVTLQPSEEILLQLAYKDSQIIELDSEIQRLHQTVIDLRENISEKEEVMRARDQAVEILRSAKAETESELDRAADERHTNNEVMSLLQQQLLEAKEVIFVREKSLEQLTEELNARNQHVAELSSHLTSYQNSYATLEASHADLERAHSAAVDGYSELETRFADSEKMYGDLVMRHASLQENNRTLEAHSATVQASHAELNQCYRALEDSYSTLQEMHASLESSFMQLQASQLELEQSGSTLAKSDCEVQTDMAGNYEEASVGEQMTSEQCEQGSRDECEQLRASLADCESRFSKFKSLAGSKIKALEKELAELNEVHWVAVLF